MFVPATSDLGPGAGPQPLADLSVDRLEAEIAELSAQISAATCRWLELVAEFDRRDAHEQSGFHSCSSWLAWRCGIEARAAREHVRVARALGDLPAIHASFARGELSYSKARALTRVAEAETEEELLDFARHATAAQLERICRAYAGAMSVEEANEAHRQRFFSYSWEEGGSLAFSGRLDAEEGALFLRALEAAFGALRAAQNPEDEAKLTAPDALVELCEAGLSAESARRTGADRHQIVVHVDEAALTDDDPRQGSADIEHGPRLANATARRLACDASVVEIRERSGEPVSVGRKTRKVPPSMRRALHARDGGCRFPGCHHHRFTEAHHIDHWAHGGETALGNLAELCRRHHRLVHEGGYSCEWLADGELVFRRPDGQALPPSPVPRNRRRGPDHVLDANRRAGLRIDSLTGDSIGRGAPFDLDLTVDGLCRLREGRRRPRDGPAP